MINLFGGKGVKWVNGVSVSQRVRMSVCKFVQCVCVKPFILSQILMTFEQERVISPIVAHNSHFSWSIAKKKKK